MKVPERIKKAIKLAMYHGRLASKNEDIIYNWLEENNFISEDGMEGINGFNIDTLIDSIHFNDVRGSDLFIKEFEEMVKGDVR